MLIVAVHQGLLSRELSAMTGRALAFPAEWRKVAAQALQGKS
jgi:hypothetical protein